MNHFPFSVVVFDLDGTLADTAPDIAGALNRALVDLGRVTIPTEKVRHLVGNGARALVQRALAATGEAPDELVDRGLGMYLDHYADNVCEGTLPYPGVEEALDELAARGVALAICTNKVEKLALGLVEALGWNGRFRSIVGSDTVASRKPDPAPLHEAIARAGGGRAAFVSDSMIDADTARAANVPFVAVSFGFSAAPATEFGADAVIDRFDELLPALTAL